VSAESEREVRREGKRRCEENEALRKTMESTLIIPMSDHTVRKGAI